MNRFDYRLSKLYLKFLFKVFFIKFNIYGKENIPEYGPVIVTPNHQCNIDPMIIFHAFTRPIPFMTKKELFSIPVFSWVMNQVGNFPVKRGAVDRGAMDAARQRLEEELAICIFPEGTRTKNGDIAKFKSGVSYIWKSADFPPILPVAIDGSIDLLKKGDFMLSPGIVNIKFGKVMHVDKNIWNDDKRKESAGLVAEMIEEQVRKLYAELKEGNFE